MLNYFRPKSKKGPGFWRLRRSSEPQESSLANWRTQWTALQLYSLSCLGHLPHLIKIGKRKKAYGCKLELSCRIPQIPQITTTVRTTITEGITTSPMSGLHGLERISCCRWSWVPSQPSHPPWSSTSSINLRWNYAPRTIESWLSLAPSLFWHRCLWPWLPCPFRRAMFRTKA